MLDWLLDPSRLPLVTLAVPAVGAILILLTGRWKNIREASTLLTASCLLFVVTQYWPSGQSHSVELIQIIPDLIVRLELEPLGMVYALVASILWIVTTIYAIGYMRGNSEKKQTRFYFCFALAIFSSIGIAFAGNIFTLFLFYELMTLSTYPLVTHKGDANAMRGGRTYLGILLGTSICFLLPAILWTWSVTGGQIDFVSGGVFGGALAAGLLSATQVGILYFLFVYGIGKAALMPVHRWLPAAMVAPTPVSALLHAVAVVKAGVFSIVKVTVYIFGIDTLTELGQGEWLLYMASATILIASFIALFQDNLKRRLAYSTISQLSYIILAVALFKPLGILAASLHIFAHAFGKITLFFAAGSIYTAAHKTKVSELNGIGRKMPITMGAFAIGSLSMIGVPPTAGFISKFYLIQGAWQAEQTSVLLVITLSTLLNASYFLPIVYRAFFCKADEDSEPHGEAPWPIVFAISFTATATIVLFFYSELIIQLGRSVLENIPG